jgi:hypothetical protein
MIYMRSGFIRNKFLLVLLCLFLGSFAAFSQRMIEIKYEADSKGGYLFSCYNYAFCNYVLDLGFTSFKNVQCDRPLPFHGEVVPGYNKLFTITAIDPQSAAQFNYSSRNQKGCMHPVVNRNFIYLLPITPGKDAQVYEMSPDKLDTATRTPAAGKLPAEKQTDSSYWYVLRLKMKSGDTIYASRKGVVTELQDQNSANDAGQSSVGRENYIEIVHADCSFARYGILKKSSALVKPGQPVKAGQPIGLVGGDAYGRGSDLKFSVYYYQEESLVSSTVTQLHYVQTVVWTKNNGKGRLKHGVVYTSEFPAAVVNQETAGKLKVKSKK